MLLFKSSLYVPVILGLGSVNLANVIELQVQTGIHGQIQQTLLQRDFGAQTEQFQFALGYVSVLPHF